MLALVAIRPQLTAVQIGESVGITQRQVQSVMAKLKSLGLVRREGANKKGRWIVSDEVHHG